MNWFPSNYYLSTKPLPVRPAKFVLPPRFKIGSQQKRNGTVWFPVYVDGKFWEKFKTVSEVREAIEGYKEGK